MSSDEQVWISWAQTLHRWGIARATAAFLEEAGPLTLLAAQFVYFCQPLFRPLLFDANLEEIGRVLEDSQSTGEFIALLKGGEAK